MKRMVLVTILAAFQLHSYAIGESSSERSIKAEYIVSNAYPPMNSSSWTPLSLSNDKAINIEKTGAFTKLWIRASIVDNESKWVIYGPLSGENQNVEIIQIGSNSPESIQFSSAPEVEKLKCCRVKVRIRIVSKKPKVTVKEPIPQITLRWRKPIPDITIRGPIIVVKDLPSIPEIDSPVPTDNIPNRVGIGCEVSDGEAEMKIQNGEDSPVDVWIKWKGSNLGPARIEKKSMRSLGRTGYPDCKLAEDNIYIVKARFPGGW